jgi:uncharacterized membrane protein HdeD (DUF308 family)
MINPASSTLLGAVAMGSLVAALFFLRFWQQTRDSFFLLFAIAFGLDAVTRLALGLFNPSQETEPLFYISRLVTFSLIIAAIVQKNRPDKPRK